MTYINESLGVKLEINESTGERRLSNIRPSYESRLHDPEVWQWANDRLDEFYAAHPEHKPK